MRAALLLASSAHRAHLPSELHDCDDLRPQTVTRVAVCGDFVSLRAEGAQVDAALSSASVTTFPGRSRVDIALRLVGAELATEHHAHVAESGRPGRAQLRALTLGGAA